MADKLEGNSEHRTYQEGVLEKTKDVAVITVSLLTAPCSQFSGILTSGKFAEKTVSARATADVLPFVLKPYLLDHPSGGIESTEAHWLR